jgi:uncharacterized protein (DUF1499 family)
MYIESMKIISFRSVKVTLLLMMLLGFSGAVYSGGSMEQQDTGDRSTTSLAPCPNSPNCVSTKATDDQHGIEPLTFTGTAEETMTSLVAVVNEMVRTTIIKQTDLYLHVEYRTRIGFVDDVDFLLDPDNKTVNFRSASRVGYGDMGVNRKRMEEFRQRYSALQGD